MHVAVTFCNQHSSPRLEVGAVDLDCGSFRWLPVPDSFDRGAAGIAEIDGDLLVACQVGGLVRYGPDLTPVATLPTPGLSNLHSIAYRPNERAVYVAAAHDDTLYRCQLDEAGTAIVSITEVFCADPRRRGEDRYHLNSVADWHGELYVTMFGPADGPTHRHRRNGRVTRVADGETIAEDLYHPHSLYALGDDLLVIESQARRVRRVAGGPPASWEIPGGYPRGIVAADGSCVWVGVSALRRTSSSQGTPNVLTSASPIDFRTRLVELDLATGEIGREVDLTLLAAEVFELHALPPGVTFAASPDRGLPARVEALEETLLALRASRRSLQQELERTPARRVGHFARRAQRVLRRVRRRAGRK